MKAEDIARLRLRSQGLAAAPFASPADVVRWLGAVQSQEYELARWSVAQRCASPSHDVLDQALSDGTILRTHVLRPTWHFVHRDDIRWLLDLSAPRLLAATVHRHRQLELDGGTLARSIALMAAALDASGALTRKELAAVLEREGVATTGQRLAHILMHAEMLGLVCSGAPRGRQQTYALLEDRAADSAWLPRDEALYELTVRYFRSRGPATTVDFRWWSGLVMSDVKRGLALAGAELEATDIQGRRYYHGAFPTDSPHTSSTAQLIQEFDEYLVGYTESRGMCDTARVLGPAATLTRAVLVDGQVAGRWRRAGRRSGSGIEIEPLRALTAMEQRAVKQAVRLCDGFLDGAAALNPSASAGSGG